MAAPTMTREPKQPMNPVQHLLVFAVRLYRWTLSPAKVFLFGPLAQCRFTPSCSEYALSAIRRHGVRAGSRLAVRRICRCHPWGDCGHDPVPPREAGDHPLAALPVALPRGTR